MAHSEIAAIREWVMQRGRPISGSASAFNCWLSPPVARSVWRPPRKWVFGKVELNGLGRSHPLTAGLKTDARGHAVAPRGSHPDAGRRRSTGSSPVTPSRSCRWAAKIFATQFHGELTLGLIERWAHIPQYLEWLEAAMGPGAYDRVLADSRLALPKSSA